MGDGLEGHMPCTSEVDGYLESLGSRIRDHEEARGNRKTILETIDRRLERSE